jgi:hypothetical protein
MAGYPKALRFIENLTDKNLLDESSPVSSRFSFRIAHAETYRTAEGLYGDDINQILADLSAASAHAPYLDYWRSVGYDELMIQRHVDALQNPKFLPHVLSPDGSFELSSTPIPYTLKHGVVPGQDIMGQAAADWWNNLGIELNDFMRDVIKLRNSADVYDFDTIKKRGYPYFEPSMVTGSYVRDEALLAFSKSLAMKIDHFLLSKAGVDPADCYQFTTYDELDSSILNVVDGACGGCGVTVFVGYTFDKGNPSGQQRTIYAYRSQNYLLRSWGFQSTGQITTVEHYVKRPMGTSFPINAAGNIKIGSHQNYQKLSINICGPANAALVDIIGSTISCSINSITGDKYLQVKIAGVYLEQGITPPDEGIPWVTMTSTNMPLFGDINGEYGWYIAHQRLYGDRAMYSSLPGYVPLATYPHSMKLTYTEGSGLDGEAIPYFLISSSYMAVVWSRHVQTLRIFPTLVQTSVVNNETLLEVSTDVIYTKTPMLYIKDYALQLKELDPSKAADVDKLVLDMSGYEDAVLTATFLNVGLPAPFEVLKNTRAYAIAMEIGQDIYDMNFAKDLTFKTAQNRINALPDQAWWVKVWDDALTSLDLVGASLQSYIDAQVDYYVAQTVDDSAYHIVNLSGAVAIDISTMDAISLIVAGLIVYDGDGVVYNTQAVALALINDMLGTEFNMSDLTIGSDLSGGDWTSFSPDVFTDESGYPRPEFFSGDAAARMWMVYKGVNLSPLENIMKSLHDLNPYLVIE